MKTNEAMAGTITRETIQQMVDLIAEHFHPEKVILFGSHARGDATDQSDVDLLVLFEKAPPEGRRSAPILRVLGRHFGHPVDVVVRTCAGFEEWRCTFGSLARRVAREGIVLYEKAR